MKFENLSYTPGNIPLYPFTILTDQGLPRDLTGYGFRFEAFNETGNPIYQNQTPESVVGNVVTFSIQESTDVTAFSEGNYAYRIVGIAPSPTNQVMILVKGFITVVPPIILPTFEYGNLTAANITDFNPAVQAIMVPYVQAQLAATFTSITLTPNNLPTDGVTDATSSMAAMHDYIVALGGGQMRMPAGTFVVGDIDWHPSVSLWGSGRSQTKFISKDGTAVAGLTLLARAQGEPGVATPQTSYHPEFRDFSFDGNADNQTGTPHGIYVINASADPDSRFNEYDTSVYGSIRMVNVVMTNVAGTGVRQEGNRHRAYYENVQIINSGQNNLYVGGNDSVVGPRCGFGGAQQHSLSMAGASGAMVIEANIWGNSPTRSETCLGLNIQSCNGVLVSNCNINDTVRMASNSNQSERGVTFVGNTFKPHDEIFSSDGVVVNGGDNTNCHIWVQNYDHVIIRGNVFDSATVPEGNPVRRFKYLVVAQNGACVDIDAAYSTNADSTPYALAGYEPFLTDNTSVINYSITELSRNIKRQNGTLALGIAPTTDAGNDKDLIVNHGRFMNPLEIQGTIILPFNTGSRAIAMSDGGTFALNSTVMNYLMQSTNPINTYNLVLPAGMSDGHQLEFHFQDAVSLLTVTAASGTSIYSYAFISTAMPKNGYLRFLYRSSTTQWNLMNTLPSAGGGGNTLSYTMASPSTTSAAKVSAGAEITAVVTSGFATLDITTDSDAVVQAGQAKWTTAVMSWAMSSIIPTKIYHNCWIRFNCTSGSVVFTVDPAGTSAKVTTPLTVVQDGTMLPRATNGGFKVLVTGASIDSRNHPTYGQSNYTRTSGVASCTVSSQPNNWLPGNAIRIAAHNFPNIEGQFTLLSFNTTTKFATWADARPDIAPGVVGDGAVDFHDLQAYAFTAAWVQHFIMGMGGRVQPYIIATSGSTVSDWFDTSRLQTIAANGPYSMIVISGGAIGNAIKGQGRSGVGVFNDVIAQINMLVQITNCNKVVVCTPPPNRNITPDDSGLQAGDPVGRLTSGSIAYRKFYRDLVARLPFVQIAPTGESLLFNYGGTTTTDMSMGWGDNTYFNPDGTHYSYPANRTQGNVVAMTCQRDIQPYQPEGGAYSDNRSVTTVTDPDGNKHPNLAPGLWGTVATTTASGPGISGTYPTQFNPNATWTFRGTASMAMSVATDLEGGTNWFINVTDTASTTQGPMLQLDLSPTWLLNALNDATVQHKEIDIFFPMSVSSPQNEFGLIYCTVGLYATVGGTEYHLSSAFANDGNFGMVSQGRAMDCGFGGVLRFPRFTLQAQTYTACSLRLQFQHINSTNAPFAVGGYTIMIGGQQRFEVVL